MRKSRYSDEEIAHTVRQAEAGAPVVDIVRELGISEATFFAWKKRVDRLLANAQHSDVNDGDAQRHQLAGERAHEAEPVRDALPRPT